MDDWHGKAQLTVGGGATLELMVLDGIRKEAEHLIGLCISYYLQIPALPESRPDFLLWWAVIWEYKKNKLSPPQVADGMVFYHSNKNLNQNRNWYQRVNYFCDRPEHVFVGGYGRTLGWKRLKDESSTEHCGRKGLTGRLQTHGIRGNGQRNTTEH